MRFLMAVLSITRAARRAVNRRKCWVSAGGSHTRGKKSQRKSCANTNASTLSVLILASAIAFVFSGLDTTTSATNGFRMATTSHVFVVASSATLSVGCKYLRPNSSNPSRVHPQHWRSSTFPASLTIPLTASSLWISSPTYRLCLRTAVPRTPPCGGAEERVDTQSRRNQSCSGHSAHTYASSQLNRVSRRVVRYAYGLVVHTLRRPAPR